MNIKINYQKSDAYMKNMAYIRALLIRYSVESLPNTQEEKNQILQAILQYLKEN